MSRCIVLATPWLAPAMTQLHASAIGGQLTCHQMLDWARHTVTGFTVEGRYRF